MLEYTLASPYVRLFELKKVFLEYSVHLVHRHLTANDLPQTA